MSDLHDGSYAEEAMGFQKDGRVRIHPEATCEKPCPFHGPSDHHMVMWPRNIRLDRDALVERTCPHGISHPDPDSMAYMLRHGSTDLGVHGCDGCCRGAS